MSVNVSWNFCRVLQISPKHLKIYQYESCPVCQGTQLSCRLAFQILGEKGEKLDQLLATPVHRDLAAFKVWLKFMQNMLRKTP
jgi:negative regulator of sigma E activity